MSPAGGRGSAVLWIVPAALLLDQATKLIALHALSPQSPVPVLGDILRLTLIHNRGAAFGITIGGPLAHTVVAVGALALLVWMYLGLPPEARLQRGALALIVGGALGNIVDRVRLREVVDFIDVGLSAEGWRWPVFNVADSCVTVGVLLLLFSYSRQGKPAPAADPAPADEPVPRDPPS